MAAQNQNPAPPAVATAPAKAPAAAPPLTPVTPTAPTPAAAQQPPPVVNSAHFTNGRITRSGMLAQVAAGRSVLHKGRVITAAADVPSESQLAQDYLAGDQQSIAEQRVALANDEAASRVAQTYGHMKPSFDERRRRLDEADAKLATSTAETQEQALENLRRKREALDAEEAALKAAAKK